jgi:hypothetical protein
VKSLAKPDKTKYTNQTKQRKEVRRLNIKNEKIIGTFDARDIFEKILPSRPARSTVITWIKEGVYGVQLEGGKIGKCFWTTPEAIQRFVEAQNKQQKGDDKNGKLKAYKIPGKKRRLAKGYNLKSNKAGK